MDRNGEFKRTAGPSVAKLGVIVHGIHILTITVNDTI